MWLIRSLWSSAEIVPMYAGVLWILDPVLWSCLAGHLWTAPNPWYLVSTGTASLVEALRKGAKNFLNALPVQTVSFNRVRVQKYFEKNDGNYIHREFTDSLLIKVGCNVSATIFSYLLFNRWIPRHEMCKRVNVSFIQICELYDAGRFLTSRYDLWTVDRYREVLWLWSNGALKSN